MGDMMQNRLYAVAATFSVLPVVFVGLRLWARRVKRVKLGWDDFTIMFALVRSSSYLGSLNRARCLFNATVLRIAVSHKTDTAVGGLGKASKTNADGIPIYDNTYWTHMKVSFGNRLSQVLAIGPTKMSVLFFYRRIFGNSGRTIFDNASMVLMIICAAWTVAYFFGNLFHYMPIKMLWTVTADKLPAPNKQLYLTQCYIDIATDALIISLPIPITFDPDPDFQTYYLATITYWTLIEAGLGIIAACLPLLVPIVRKMSWVLTPRSGQDDIPLNPKNPSPPS
uniref:Phomoidride biosynthesis cluster protein H n=1 Tax=Fungal sp. (strain ATCC 74256) TaxID=1729595 RepID=PHIH_FUNX7|nr:RecName: Full=Phomoidride biosynthesis cluster protein H [fungal sp. ATCC 74256]BBG28505.1 putative hypothetical protein [fungal sp. ATCC 74256]